MEHLLSWFAIEKSPSYRPSLNAIPQTEIRSFSAGILAPPVSGIHHCLQQNKERNSADSMVINQLQKQSVVGNKLQIETAENPVGGGRGDTTRGRPMQINTISILYFKHNSNAVNSIYLPKVCH